MTLEHSLEKIGLPTATNACNDLDLPIPLTRNQVI